MLRRRSLQSEWVQFFSLLFLGIIVIWLLIELEVLYAVDAPVYASIGKELALKPFSEWAVLSWNSNLFFEHPHLQFWLLGLSIKLFGAKTLPALLPSLVLGTLTLPLVYLIGRLLLNHQLGLLAGFALLFTPRFVRMARNPMIEASLTFFVFLSLYLALLALRETQKRRRMAWGALSGVAFALAFLAKGPPALLVLAILTTFVVCLKGSYRTLTQLLLFQVGIALALVLGVDFWHFQISGQSFFKTYLTQQVLASAQGIQGRGSFPFSFYLHDLLRGFIPWYPFALASIPIGFYRFYKKDQTFLPLLVFGIASFWGCILGFSLVAKKSPWYLDLATPGNSLLAGLTLYLIFRGHLNKYFERYFSRFCITLGVGTLFFCSLFPSLFQYNRDGELFIAEASRVVQQRLEGREISDCIYLNSWNGPSLVKYYLGAKLVACQAQAGLKFVRSRDALLECGYTDLYSAHTFSLIEHPGLQSGSY